MRTVVSKLYWDTISDLADDFAMKHALQFPSRCYKKSYNATMKVYHGIALFLYIRTNKISLNRRKFEFNQIHSSIMKKFSCKLYHKIMLDLEKNKMIKINNHYFHNRSKNSQAQSFSKSFLMHKDVLCKIDETKLRLNYELISIEVPQKVTNALNGKNCTNNEDRIVKKNKLNRYYRDNNQEKKISFYNQLEYDENALEKFCKNDDIKYNQYWKRLSNLKESPKYVKGRWYHIFHELPKKARESILRYDNETIKEIFDVSASDLHMLAKILEDESIPEQELLQFQKEVKKDAIRKEFGTTKAGRCKENVKKAFKVWLNSKPAAYGNFKEWSICSRIDKWFEKNYPSVRKFIIKHDDFWLLSMKKEFEVLSIGIINKLKKRGIEALTCHDAIYVKQSVNVPDIKDIFYKELNLLVDQIGNMYDL